MFDVLIINGALARYRESVGDAPPPGWQRMTREEIAALPRPAPPIDDPDAKLSRVTPVILQSPNGDRWALTIDDAGNIGRRKV